jgi:hypothetical protein
LARGLGVPKDWALAPEHCTARLLGETTSVFHWEYLSHSLLRLHDRTTVPVPDPLSLSTVVRDSPLYDPTDWEHASPAETPIFTWSPPDLRVGAPWYQTRLANLGRAVQGLPDPVGAFKDGLAALDVH